MMNTYDYKKIRKEVIRIVRKNLDSWERWEYHILPVAKNIKILSKGREVDYESLEIAGYLHDFTRIQGDKKNHHITGSEKAKEILEKLDYPSEKIKMIQRLILSHRGSTRIKRTSVEEEILASADALAIIQSPIPMFHKVFYKKRMTMDEGKKWIRKKVVRSFKKMSIPEAKALIIDKYKALIDLLDS